MRSQRPFTNVKRVTVERTEHREPSRIPYLERVDDVYCDSLQALVLGARSY